VWTFSPALKTGFHRFDDDVIFLRNSHVNTGLSWQNVRWALFSRDYSYSYPLPRISHMLDFTLYGAEPWGHHLTNVLIHAANGVLLFLVLRRMTGALWRSLIVALLFALHPLRVESVVWVSERKDVMSTCFGLFALLAYARYAREPGARSKEPEAIPNRSTFSFLHAPFYWLSLLFFAFALMSKSMLVTFPCLLLVLDYWPLRRVTGDQWQVAGILRLVLEKIPFFVLVGLVSVATWFASRAGGGTFIMHLPWPNAARNRRHGLQPLSGIDVLAGTIERVLPLSGLLANRSMARCHGAVSGNVGSRLRLAAPAALVINRLVMVCGNAGTGDWADPVGRRIHLHPVHLHSDDGRVVIVRLGH
jgi:hypothetical protein